MSGRRGNSDWTEHGTNLSRSAARVVAHAVAELHEAGALIDAEQSATRTA